MAEKQPDASKPDTNILTTVSPPSALPSFILNQVSEPEKSTPKVETQNPSVPNVSSSSSTTFSPIIPESLAKNYHPDPPTEQINTSDFDKLTLNPEPASSALNPLLNQVSGSSFLNWVKGAADASGELLQKIGEKAINSMDTIVTTLDPQMKEYIKSGGDVEIIVASDKDNKVRPIREAFQLVFGRATIMGLPVNAEESTIASQPVGFEAASKACRMRTQQMRATSQIGNRMPVIALENFLVELYPEHWFDVGMLTLDEPGQNIFLEAFTQMTPIPASVAVNLAAETPKDYKFLDSGFSVTVGQVMGANLAVPNTEWHKHYAGVERSEMIYLAAKSLATIYKNILAIKADSPEEQPVVLGEEAIQTTN